MIKNKMKKLNKYFNFKAIGSVEKMIKLLETEVIDFSNMGYNYKKMLRVAKSQLSFLKTALKNDSSNTYYYFNKFIK